MSKLYSLTSEVAAYVLLFCRWPLRGVDWGEELGCNVVCRLPVGRGRWWTVGHAVDWPEVRGGIEAVATGADGLLLDIPDERWCARSTRHRAQAVRRRVSCLDIVFLYMLWTVSPFRKNSLSFQVKVLTGVGDLSEMQVDVPLPVRHSCIWPYCWAQ